MAQPQTKRLVRDLLDRLPEDCSLEDVQYHLYVLDAVQQGLDDAGTGRVLSHDQVKTELRRKWLKSDA